MPNYHNVFREAETVATAPTERILKYRDDWGEYYHEPSLDQLQFAGHDCIVRQVIFDRGGECLYELKGISPRARENEPQEHNIPGVWHEDCLTESLSSDNQSQIQPANMLYIVESTTRSGEPVIVVRMKGEWSAW